MKKFFLCILLLLIALSFAGAISFSGAFDTGLIQDFAIKTSSYNAAFDLRFDITKNFQARVGFGLIKNTSAQMFETGVFLSYYPFDNYGFFTGLSLFQFGFVSPGNTISKNNVSLNEVILGWTVKTKGNLFIEPSISIRDPSGTFTDEYSNIKAAFPCYKNFRAHLYAGWKFNINKFFKGVKNE